jgi:lipoprotein-anchoring transpeptidase ErfK/SrfK
LSLANWMRTTNRSRRRFLVDGAALSGSALVLAACGGGNEVVVTQIVTPGQPTDGASSSSAVTTSASAAPASTTSAGPQVRIIAEPKFGSTDVGPLTPMTITTFNATISDLTMTSADGTQIAGTLDASGAAWTLTDRLEYGQTYTFTGTATDTAGTATPITGTIATVRPLATVPVTFVQDEGGTFGVGQPAVIVFDGQVTNKGQAEKQLKLTTDKGDLEGSWGWLQDEDIQGDGILRSQVHWRPKDYWPANTAVSISANVYGVDYGNGNWGRADVTVNFKIGRKIVTIADVNSFRLRVLDEGGNEIKNYPVSYGKADNGRETKSGTHIVQGKYPTYSMCNAAFNYCGVDVTWAVRINNNGEFIHENDSTIPYQGKANVSHGCVNMSTANAKDYYDLVVLGDPVEVSGTNSPLTAADYVYDWSYSYDTWKSFSAL